MVYAGTVEIIQSALSSIASYTSEWHVVSLLVTFVAGFLCGLLYALRVYKKIEVDADREWAKRRGMPEMQMPEMQRQGGDRPRGVNPVLRQQRL
jgi:hypothetical protein